MKITKESTPFEIIRSSVLLFNIGTLVTEI
jgi:hypothetical protein